MQSLRKRNDQTCLSLHLDPVPSSRISLWSHHVFSYTDGRKMPSVRKKIFEKKEVALVSNRRFKLRPLKITHKHPWRHGSMHAGTWNQFMNARTRIKFNGLMQIPCLSPHFVFSTRCDWCTTFKGIALLVMVEYQTWRNSHCFRSVNIISRFMSRLPVNITVYVNVSHTG